MLAVVLVAMVALSAGTGYYIGASSQPPTQLSTHPSNQARAVLFAPI